MMQKQYNKILFIALLFSFGSIFGQTNPLDSLALILKNNPNDTLKLKVLVEISDVCPEEDILKYAEPAYQLSLQLIKSTNYEVKISAQKKLASACNNIGYAYMGTGDIAAAIRYYEKSLAIRKELKDAAGMGQSLINIGYLLENKGDISKALENYHNGLFYYEKANDKSGMAYALNNIGFIYQKQDDLNKALEYYLKSKKIREEIGDKHGLSQSLTNIGAIYKNQNNYDEALKTHLKSLQIQQELNDKLGVANSYNNIGYIYEHRLDYGLALDYYQKSFEIRESSNEKKGMANCLINLARIYYIKNSIQNATEKAHQSLKISKDLGFPENISNASNLLAKIYNRQGKYRESVEMYELYIKMHDSINNESIRKDAAKQQLRYEYGKKAVADSVKYAEFQKVKDAQIVAQQLQIEGEKTKRWALFGGLFLLLVFAAFMFNRFKVTQKQKAIIETQKKDVEIQKEMVEEKQKEILDSINYAKRIQYTLLAHQELLIKNIPDHFILFQPKDIVSGDFYWATEKENLFYLAVCDSTGHGVPGAFMSLLNISFMNEAINEKNILAPNKIFDYVRDRLISSISQEGAQDGMDGTLLCINKSTNEITYAAAHNAPLLIKNGSAIKFKADKMPIGKGINESSFELFSINAQKGDMLYLYTDGYADQFGGPKGKKFKYNQLNELLTSFSSENSVEQQKKLAKKFAEWKGTMEQVDDVLILGIRI